MNGNYFGNLYETAVASGIWGVLLAVTWLLFPVAVVTIWHPEDAVNLQLWLQGFVIQHIFSRQAMNAGLGAAVLAVAVLFLCQLVLVTLIYRRSGRPFKLWPLSLVLVGVIANGIWWLKYGYFDFTGAMAGLSPVFATIACHSVCEKLGSDFVFGKDGQEYEGGF
jgi:hypothetical protein